ncbi:MAG: type II secretion system F family protein [Candidatus Diapherotrites archaeon]|nr:type II secretion system F family protein [Candidatus Diapherotrites archaeon]
MKLFTGLERDLQLAEMRNTKEEWLKYCVMAGAAAFVAAVAFWPMAAPVAAGLSFAAVYKVPWYRKKSLAGRVEAELPLALRSMATLIAVGLPFEEALQQSCEGSGLARHVGIALKEVEFGAAVPQALNSMVARVDSGQLQKAVMQLNSIYSKRGGASALKKLSEEIAAMQKAALREYSGKLAVYSLVFIAVSAILPALFQAYVIVGSAFMSVSLTPSDAFWIPVLAFPTIDLAILAFIKLKRPFFA